MEQALVAFVESGSWLDDGHANVAHPMPDVASRTVWRWLVRGRRERAGPYRRFFKAMQQAVERGKLARRERTGRKSVEAKEHLKREAEKYERWKGNRAEMVKTLNNLPLFNRDW